MAKAVFASHNTHKRDEVWAIVSPELPHWKPEDLASAKDFGLEAPVENGVTFAQNALIKARAACEATGLPAISDDSGLCVNVMGGAPGIFSAIWSGKHGADDANLDLLLAQLEDIPVEHRAASFECAAALVMPDGREVVAYGRMDGSIARRRAGKAGFGYDPIFIPEGHDVTAAELTAQEKNAISHRFKALAELGAALALIH